MARGVNKVILIGNLGNSPEVRYAPSGSAVTTVSLATSDSWKDKQTGEQQDRTEWHRVVFFGHLAEVVEKYLRKGSKVFVEGALRTRKWQDKSGQDRYTTEIVASEMQMLDNKGTSYEAEDSPHGAAIHRNGSSDKGDKTDALPHADIDEGFDEDIPF